MCIRIGKVVGSMHELIFILVMGFLCIVTIHISLMSFNGKNQGVEGTSRWSSCRIWRRYCWLGVVFLHWRKPTSRAIYGQAQETGEYVQDILSE